MTDDTDGTDDDSSLAPYMQPDFDFAAANKKLAVVIQHMNDLTQMLAELDDLSDDK